jgi:hypothetical protein
VEIAPRSSGDSISLDATTSNGPTVLSLSVATLRAINTVGTPDINLPGVGELVLGSLNGGISSAVTAISITAGFTLPSVQTLALFANGPIAETGSGALTVNAVAGYGSTILLQGGTNAIGFLGVPTQQAASAQTYQTDPILQTNSQGNLQALQNFEVLAPTTTGTGSVRVHDTTGTLSVVGTLIAANGQTIDLAAPDLLIDATQPSGLVNAGSLVVNASTTAPGRVLLAGDTLAIVSAGTAPIVTALEGDVVIAPFNAGGTIHSISIDSSVVSSGTNLSLAIRNLALIQTITQSDTSATPLGMQTLAIGSLDGGSTVADSGITINVAMPLNGGTNVVANNLALYSTGTIKEAGSGAVTVSALYGSAATVGLTGTNTIATLGGFTAGSFVLNDVPNLTINGPVAAGTSVAIVDTGRCWWLARLPKKWAPSCGRYTYKWPNPVG